MTKYLFIAIKLVYMYQIIVSFWLDVNYFINHFLYLFEK
jgi:hypothetical protein